MENQLEMTPTSIVALFETDKIQRQSFVTMLVDAIDNGEVDALKVHIQIKCMEDIIKQLNDTPVYREAVTKMAETFGQKEFQFMNAKISLREVGVKYDFSKCEDPKQIELSQAKDDLSKKLKDREDFLKLAPIEGTLITDENTGETVKVFPPSKTSTTSVVVSLK
jgi:hypothetical protein